MLPLNEVLPDYSKPTLLLVHAGYTMGLRYLPAVRSNLITYLLNYFLY